MRYDEYCNPFSLEGEFGYKGLNFCLCKSAGPLLQAGGEFHCELVVQGVCGMSLVNALPTLPHAVQFSSLECKVNTSFRGNPGLCVRVVPDLVHLYVVPHPCVCSSTVIHVPLRAKTCGSSVLWLAAGCPSREETHQAMLSWSEIMDWKRW